MDWHEIFTPTVPALELMLRGTLMYLGILFVIRLLLLRVAGNITVTDLIMVVLIADAAQNGMSAEYRSVTEGGVLVGTIIFWNYALDRLAFRFPVVERLIHPPPLPLIRNGKLLWRNMRTEFISREELMGQLREKGIEDIANVELAYIEGDGRISVISHK